MKKTVKLILLLMLLGLAALAAWAMITLTKSNYFMYASVPKMVLYSILVAGTFAGIGAMFVRVLRK